MSGWQNKGGEGNMDGGGVLNAVNGEAARTDRISHFYAICTRYMPIFHSAISVTPRHQVASSFCTAVLL